MIENNGIYLTNQTYQQNVDSGPSIKNAWIEELNNPIKYQHQSVKFLGYQLNNALGVAAGPLLSSSWVDFAAKLNYSVITYKTIRSHAYPCHPIPNVISVENNPIRPIKLINRIFTKDCTDLKKLTITNSFGMPSQSAEYLLDDIPKAKNYLKKGQILVVSVVASDMNHPVDDFYKITKFTENLGVDAIELNLSCPNVKDPSAVIYMDDSLTYQICKKITNKLQVPLIIKIGYIEDKNLFEKVLINAEKAGVSAVSGINSYSLKVYKQGSHVPALSESRLSGGICGYAIKPIGIHFTQMASSIIEKNKLKMALIGMGGVMNPKDFNDYLQSGADIVMTATGMMWQPMIAKEYAKKYQSTLISK